MEIKKIDLKKAHFGSKQEEWTYYQLLFLEVIDNKLEKLIEVLEKKPIKIPDVKTGEIQEIDIVEQEIKEEPKKEIVQEKIREKPKKRGRKKKKADDIK